jgi:D-alanyl-D-alanine dipeptidase
MGAALTDFGKKCHTETDLINDKQRENRKLLFDAMTKAGFINYPLEWWHYSFGDVHWAAYTNHTECPYGFI